jgi:hypothetical protein
MKPKPHLTKVTSVTAIKIWHFDTQAEADKAVELEVRSRWGIRSLVSCARPNLFPQTKHASVSSCRTGGSTTIVPMLRSPDPPLYPDETEIARRVLGERAREWPGMAAVLEREGLPKIDRLMGGRFWPAVQQFFLDRHGVATQPSHGAPLPAKSRVRLVPFAPDGEPDFDGERIFLGLHFLASRVLEVIGIEPIGAVGWKPRSGKPATPVRCKRRRSKLAAFALRR